MAVEFVQGGRKLGKPVILRDFSEHGKLQEFCATSWKNCNKRSILRETGLVFWIFPSKGLGFNFK